MKNTENQQQEKNVQTIKYIKTHFFLERSEQQRWWLPTLQDILENNV